MFRKTICLPDCLLPFFFSLSSIASDHLFCRFFIVPKWTLNNGFAKKTADDSLYFLSLLIRPRRTQEVYCTKCCEKVYAEPFRTVHTVNSCYSCCCCWAERVIRHALFAGGRESSQKGIKEALNWKSVSLKRREIFKVSTWETVLVSRSTFTLTTRNSKEETEKRTPSKGMRWSDASFDFSVSISHLISGEEQWGVEVCVCILLWVPFLLLLQSFEETQRNMQAKRVLITQVPFANEALDWDD